MTFGTTTLCQAGAPIHVASRKALAVLTFVALNKRLVRRDILADLLWPGSPDPAHARMALRHTLYQVRHIFDDSASQLVISPTHVGVTDLFVTDIDVLETALMRDASPAQQEAGFAAYTGPFWGDDRIADAPEWTVWVASQQSYYEERFACLAERLVVAHLDAGQTSRALAMARTWLERQPRCEAACRALMVTELRAGDVSGALATFARCQQELAQLGSSPSAATVEVAERCQHMEQRGHVIPAVTERLLPFTGRAAPLATLRQAFRAAAKGQPQMIQIVGEAGIGKTRLTDEFAAWVRTEGGMVCVGRAFDVLGHLPYHPIADALLPQFQAINAPDDLLADVWLTELSRLLPDLRDRYPDLALPTMDDGAQGRLYEAVTQALLAFARQQPLVVILDDMHWADRATNDLVRFIWRRCQAERACICLIVTARIEHMASDQRLGRWMQGWSREAPVHSIELAPLTPNDVHELLARLVVEAEPDALAAWLSRETGGNPLYLTQMFRMWVEQEQVQWTDAGRLLIRRLVEDWPQIAPEIPATMRQTLLARVQHVPFFVRKVLMAGAILGQRFTLAGISVVANETIDAAALALHTAKRQRILTETAQGFMFAHDLLREVIAAMIDLQYATVLHRRAVTYLCDSQASPSEIAQHALAGGEPAMAFAYLLHAGDAALAVFAASDACQAYEQARAILPAAAPSEQVEHLYLYLARAYEAVQQWEQAQTTYETLHTLASEQRWVPTAIRALVSLANFHLQQDRLADAVTRLHVAHALAKQHQQREAEGEVLWHLAHIHAHHLDLPTAIRLGEQVLAIGHILANSELSAGAASALTVAYGAAGRFAESIAAGEHAARLYASLAEQARTATHLPRGFWAQQSPSSHLAYLALQSQSIVTVSHVNIGQAHEARVVAEETLALARASHNDWAVVQAIINLNHVLLDLGQYQTALTLTREALSFARALTGKIYLLYVLIVLGRTYFQLGQWSEARTLMAEDLKLARATFPRWESVIVPHLCAVAVRQGDWDAALTYAQAAATIRSVMPGLIWQDFARWHETETWLHHGLEDAARADIADLAQKVGDNCRHRLVLLRMQAVMAEHEGHLSEAVEYLNHAIALAEQMRLPDEHWQSVAALAHIQDLSGEAEHAHAQRERAWKTVDMLAQAVEAPDARSAFLAAAERLLRPDTPVARSRIVLPVFGEDDAMAGRDGSSASA